ncbi:MAG: WYL domain-containing protein [Gemmatimonadota bacterium]|nr:WYL domain-containing protein [Gemmatimonadota bacterium]
MDRESVLQSLEERRVVQLSYRNGGARTVQPHAIVRKPDGSEVLEAYQLNGDSESGTDHGWKNFELSSIDSLELLPERFDPRRDFGVVSGEAGQVVAQVQGESGEPKTESGRGLPPA